MAIATSLASLLTDRPVRPDVAMTGEITLRGTVLPIGGVKEKLLAARRAGIRLVLLPSRNEKDLEDVPSDIRDLVEIAFVDELEQALDLALLPPGAEMTTSAEID